MWCNIHRLVNAIAMVAWTVLWTIAGDDAGAVEIASRLIRELGYEPVLVGGLEMGRHLVPGAPLAGERSADEIRRIAASLE